jgi:hypothetical protein
MDTRPGNTPSLATPVTLILLVLGFTSAGMWFTRPTGTPSEPSRLAPQSSAPRTQAAEHPKADEAQPSSPFLRPLALIATAIGPDPLFTLERAGAPELTAPYRPGIKPKEADSCLGGSPLEHAPTTTPFSEWRLSSGECAIAAELRDRARDLGVSVGIIVVTLPDWVDSNLGWMADSWLDAIQGAAAQMHYSLSGFDLVDTEPSPADIRPEGSVWPFPKVHESTPAALLFRHGSNEPGPTLLLVLLVGESATSGVHPAAMATALDIALQWQRPFRREPGTGWWMDDSVRILGPTYSGSAPSFKTALEDAVARHHLPTRDREWFKLVTGSATSPDNERTILGSSLPRIATFAATTRSDPEELTAVARYLGRTSRGWQCGHHVGLLIEANTGWGGQVLSRTPPAGLEPIPGREDNCHICLDDPDSYFQSGRARANVRENPLPCATVAHFPLHISRLRAAAAQSSQATAAAALGPRSTVGIDLSESLSPTDQIPAETPKLTAATVETMMSGLFGVLRDDEVLVVGIFATDKRDHIYLAQEIAQHRPNVLPFTLESSLLYLHPDVEGFVRGTIIASTYPLNPRTQGLTRVGQSSPQQFGGSPAQGVFNALAMLMERPQDLVDYRKPYPASEPPHPTSCAVSRDCAPPIWLSVVGRDALLPLATEAGAGCRPGRPGAYIECTEAAGEFDGITRPYLAARYSRLLMVFVLLALILASQVMMQHWIGGRVDAVNNVTAGRRGWMSSLRSWAVEWVVSNPLRRIAGIEAEHLAALAAIRGATLAILLWAAKMAIGYVCEATGLSLASGQVLFGVLAVIAIIYLILKVLLSLWPVTRTGVDHRLGRAAALVFTLTTLLAIALERRMFRVSWLIPACVAIVLIAGIVAVVSNVRTPMRESSVARWRRFPALLGIAAFAALCVDLCFGHWNGIEALFYVDRSLDIRSFISPASVIVLMSLSLMWWGMWDLRRIYLLALPETTVGIGPLLDQAADQAGLQAYNAFRTPSQEVGWPLVPLAAAIVLALLYGRFYVGSVDGFAFGVFLLLGPLCIVAIAGHTLAHSTLLGGDVVRLLHALEQHPAAGIFQAIGKAPYQWGISFDEPLFHQLEPLLGSIERAAQLLAGAAPGTLPESFNQLSAFASDQVAELRHRPRGEVPPVALRCQEWRTLDSIMRRFASALRDTAWRTGFDPALYPAPTATALERMGFAVGFHAALMLRALLTRLISGFTIVFGALLLLLIAHLLYSFQGRVYWLSLDAILMAVAAILAVRLLITLERDTVMSNIWQTMPGRISLFGGLTWRMTAYAAITLATLFVVFFPELAGRSGNWIVSARTALQ